MAFTPTPTRHPTRARSICISNAVIAFGASKAPGFALAKPWPLHPWLTRRAGGVESPAGGGNQKCWRVACVPVIATAILAPQYQCGDDLMDYFHHPPTRRRLVRHAPPLSMQPQVKAYLQNEFAAYPPYLYNHRLARGRCP
jgi:hypothetical protein